MAEATHALTLEELDELNTYFGEHGELPHGVEEALLEMAVGYYELEIERDEARAWVRRLTADSRVLTCVYCGHAYPPGSPEHGAEVLT